MFESNETTCIPLAKNNETACIPRWKVSLLMLLACLGLLSVSSVAQAAPTRCEVLDHAKRWVDKQIYYSQGPWGGYCAGSMYCDPDANGKCYRPDCSGYVSAVWGLPAPGNTTYSFAGGPWNSGHSHIISYDNLRPGDALNFAGNPNTGTGHIRLFGGWLDAAKTRMWGYETSTCGTPAYYYERSRWEFVNNGYVAIRLNGIRECAPVQPPAPPEPEVPLLTQVNSNGAISVVNWNDEEQAEVWVRGSNGALHHSWTFSNNDWSALHQFADDAACGFAAGFWPETPGYAEVFMPTNSGGTQHSWLQEGQGWQGPHDYGNRGLSQFSTLLWPNETLEVFALGNDGAIHHRFWHKNTGSWSDWYRFGGDFVTGVSAITWGDGRPELFATAADGTIWNRWWIPQQKAWSEWSSILGGDVASRPVPVRWDDGRLEVFARGNDGYLYHGWWKNDQWHTMRKLSNIKIKGEPSVVFNPKGNGGPFGPQIFARDESNRLVEMHRDNNGQWLEFRTLLYDRVLSSDPFGWIRGDGIGLLFAVDASGKLIQSHRDPATGWKPWKTISGATIDACLSPDSLDTSGPTVMPISLSDEGSEHYGSEDKSESPSDSNSDDKSDSIDDGSFDDESFDGENNATGATPQTQMMGGCAAADGAAPNGAWALFALLGAAALGRTRRRERT